MSIGVQVSGGLDRQLDGIETALDTSMARMALAAAQHAAGVMRRQIQAKLAKRPTGALMRSVEAFLVERSGKVVAAAAGPNTVYARIQDEGGTITAKGKLLAVPISSKVPLGKSPRDYSGEALRLIPRRGRNSILAQVSGKRGQRIEPLFVLKRSVRITGVHYVAAAAEEAQEGIADIFADGVDDATKK